MGQEKMEKIFISKVALGRAAEADDIAKVIVFLFSDIASYITGSVSFPVCL